MCRDDVTSCSRITYKNYVKFFFAGKYTAVMIILISRPMMEL
jgi:hypothetical protein